MAYRNRKLNTSFQVSSSTNFIQNLLYQPQSSQPKPSSHLAYFCFKHIRLCAQHQKNNTLLLNLRYKLCIIGHYHWQFYGIILQVFACLCKSNTNWRAVYSQTLRSPFKFWFGHGIHSLMACWAFPVLVRMVQFGRKHDVIIDDTQSNQISHFVFCLFIIENFCLNSKRWKCTILAHAYPQLCFSDAARIAKHSLDSS